MKIEQVDIKKVKLNPSNPRLIKDDKYKKLVKSIQEFPQMFEIRPIVVNADMVIIGGNMRYRAAVEAGYKKIPIIKATDLTPEQEKEFVIKDNVGFGEWDFDLIANEWSDLNLEDWGLDIPNSQDWGELEYIEEAEKPNFRKDNVITIVVPDALMEDISKIEQLIKDTLADNYSGCEVK